MQRRLRAVLAAAVAAAALLPLAAGCAASSSSSTPPPGGSAASTQTGPSGGGTLTAKAYAFEQIMTSRHVPDGLAVNLVVDPATNAIQSYEEVEDATIWTGIYLGAEALRYKVTGEPEALANVERTLRALHDLQLVGGDPGYVPRGFAPANLYPGGIPAGGPLAGKNYVYVDSTSRDQYAGLMFGYALAWPIIADPALRATVQADVHQIGVRLMRDDMAMKHVDATGTLQTEFNVDPTYAYADTITPQTWATVDDFPINLIAQSVPYDPALAAALQNLRAPPIRGGEALHGLVFIKVAANVSGDPALEDYYRNTLIAQRGFLTAAVDYGCFQDDILHGRNLDKFKSALIQLNHDLTAVVQAYLQQKIGVLSWPAALIIQGVFDQVLRVVGNVLADALTFLNNPNAQGQVLAATAAMQVLSQVLDFVGQHSAARTLRGLAARATPLTTSDLDDLSNTLRSYVGEDLCHLSNYTAYTQENDPAVKARYAELADHRGLYVGAEQNAWFDFIEAACSAVGPNPQRIAEGKAALAAYPVDLMDHVVDHTGEPGVTPSPWPDRFGKVGNMALELFTVDRRAPHHMMWHQHPREIRTGSNYPSVKSPLGYLAAYWLGRYHGFVSETD